MTPIEIFLVGIIVCLLAIIFTSEYVIIPRTTYQRLKEATAMWESYRRKDEWDGIWTIALVDTTGTGSPDVTFDSPDPSCHQCGFIAKSERGLSIHNTRIHGGGK